MTTPTPEFEPFERDGRPWLRHISGRELPVVSGGSDVVDAAPAADPAPDPAPAADPSPGFDGLDAEYDALEQQLADGSIDPATFQRKLSDMRSEHKQYRERWSPVASRFDGFEPAEVEDIGQFLEWYKSGDPQAAAWLLVRAQQYAGDQFATIAGKVLPDFAGAQQPAAPEVEPATEEMFDPADPHSVAEWVARQVDEKVNARLEAERRERTQQEAVQSVRSKLAELGYEWDDTKGPSERTRAVAALTATAFRGDVSKAHEFWTSTVNAEVERRLAELAPNDPPPPPAPTGQPALGAEAGLSRRERAMARISAGPTGN